MTSDNGMPRYAVFVTGPPASGKSMVAEFLTRALPEFALIEKDNLKEALFDALSGGVTEDTSAVSRRLSDAAIALLWAIAPRCPRVILEANFRTAEPREQERFRALDAKKLEIHCWCPPEVAMQRFAARTAERHRAHTVKELTLETFRVSEQPFALGPLIQVDTAKGVNLEWVLEQVRTYWPTGR
jgi:predicted kinase